MNASVLIALALAVPFAAAGLVVMSAPRPNQREGVSLGAAVLLMLLVFGLLPTVLAGGRPELQLFEVLPGLGLGFRVEPLGMLFAMVASTLWIVNSLYSIGYMRG
ncbi:MAG: monovalent cation/H+ antiporter subunit D family protein, partial [Gammaproteobacteria bacterium]|nr:monovalent cation/H+ antiporter subunit D family protein [Gammaproteobacteria bacterium]